MWGVYILKFNGIESYEKSDAAVCPHAGAVLDQPFIRSNDSLGRPLLYSPSLSYQSTLRAELRGQFGEPSEVVSGFVRAMPS